MKRRPYGRDLGLTIRMGIALVPIVLWYLLVAALLVALIAAVLAMWALARYREYVADRGSALITGGPEQLMSALQKIMGEPARGDLRGGLAVQALCIVGRQSGWRRFELLSDHPPLEKRLRRLAAISRELGKVA